MDAGDIPRYEQGKASAAIVSGSYVVSMAATYGTSIAHESGLHLTAHMTGEQVDDLIAVLREARA